MASITATASPEALQGILSSPIPFTDETEELASKELVGLFSTEEQEAIARIYYPYYLAQQKTSTGETLVLLETNDEMRLSAATRIVRRHLVFEKGNVQKAKKNVLATLQWREEMKMNLLRHCFDVSFVENHFAEREIQDAARFRAMIESEYQKQIMVVRGQDRNGRALTLKFARTATGMVDEEYLVTQLYMTERAVATTEMLQQEQILVVFDFAHYLSKARPPTSLFQKVTALNNLHYPRAMHKVILLDAPSWMSMVFTVLKPFMDSYTSQNTLFFKGDKGRTQGLAPSISPDQAMAKIMPGGQLDNEINVQHYLYHTPFHCAYNPPPAGNLHVTSVE